MSNVDEVEFLVDPPGFKAEKITAKRSAMKKISGYLHLRIKNSPSEQVVLEEVKPNIFKKVVEFAQFVDRFRDDKELIELAKAAEKFQIEPLGHLTSVLLTEIYSHLDGKGICMALSNSYRASYALSACEKVLSMKPYYMLVPSSAMMKIPPEALSRFLAFEHLEVFSEFSLVLDCISYVKENGRSTEEARELFRKYALPHLRLLTVTCGELLQVAHFLTREEALFLYHSLHEKRPLLTVKDVPEMRDSLCLVKTPRFTEETICTLTIVPQFEVHSLKDLFLGGMFSVLPWEVNKFVMSFETKKQIIVKRVGVFCPLYLQEHHFFDEKLMRNLEEMEADCTFKTVNQLAAKITIKTKKDDQIFVYMHLHRFEDVYMNRWASLSIDLPAPQDSLVTLEVTYKGKVVLRHLDRSVKTIQRENPECVNEMIDKLTLEQFYNDGNGLLRCVKKDPTTVFKNVQLFC